jgi:hypothetical protein
VTERRNRLRVAIPTGSLLAAIVFAHPAVAMRGRMQGETYFSPNGDFSCVVVHYDLGEIKVKDNFNRSAGTVSFNDFFDITRVDVEMFEKYVDPASFSQDVLQRNHEYYFERHVIPLVDAGVKDATVLSRRFIAGNVPTYESVMKLPRKGYDQIRGAIQYTDGHAMYVVSVVHAMRPELGWTMERETDDISKTTRAAFERCRFGKPGTASERK